jgi:UDP-2,4-diacetamido-2,4,6-trideoxy-beta-L-altropyranose hydrolase
MRIAIRVDASAAIGSGHVLRCLSLADELRERGDGVLFASRDMPAHLAQWVADHGHRLAALPSGAAPEPRDAADTLEVAGACDWVVVDHYGLGSGWERIVRGSGARLLAIDDLERPHEADLLLDQNLYAEPERRYADRVPAHCSRLVGPRYALLRREFAQARRGMQPRDGRVLRLLVFLGGMDAGNATEPVLRAVAAACPPDVGVDVVLGAGHPALERIRTLAAGLPDARCHVQTAAMVDLLAQADLAVGAGGTATWERCALGVPALALCIADNQRELLFNASRAGVVYAPDIAGIIDPQALVPHLRALLDNSGLRHHLSRRGLDLVDGDGARRVAAAMQPNDVAVRPAAAADRDSLHAWRNHPVVRAVSRNADEIDVDEHRRWFDRVLASDSRHLLIGERSGQPVGVVRFDVEGIAAEVSIYLVPQELGRGSGGALLCAAEAWLRQHRPELTSLRAQVRADNPPSHRLFERCGYTRQATEYAKRT